MPEPSASPLRRRALITLAVVGVFGFGGGALANQAIARFLALPDDAELPEYADAPQEEAVADAERPTPGPDHEGQPVRKPRALSEKQYVDAIVQRNIFDSTAVYDPNAAKANGGEAGECKSDSNVRLLATIVADQPLYSSALISLGGGRDAKADGFAMGDDVGGEGRITLIEQKKVCLDGGSCICIGGEAKVASAGGEKPADGEGVKGSGNKFEVEQSVLDEAMANFDQLATQVRVVPHKGSDGSVDGYRLSAIRRGSLFDKLGIKNGDIVHSVNGQALTSTEGALGVYNSLKNEKSFNFDITRRNQRQTLEYEVH